MSRQESSSPDRSRVFVGRRYELIAAAENVVGSRAVAEELVQESWLRWCTKSYDAKLAGPLLHKIVRNLALDWLRREKVERDNLAEPQLAPGTAPDGERVAIGREAVRIAAAALAELPERTQRAFVLRSVEGASYDEIGVVLGVSSQRAHQLVRAALIHVDRRLNRSEA